MDYGPFGEQVTVSTLDRVAKRGGFQIEPVHFV
jgi:hypothetical protein